MRIMKDKKIIIAFFTILFFIISSYFIRNVKEKSDLHLDAQAYYSEAKEIIKTFHSQNGNFTRFRERPIGLPALEASFLSSFGNFFDDITIIKFISSFLGAITLIPMVLIVDELFHNKSVTFLSAIFFVFNPVLIYNSIQVLTEPPFMFCFLFSVYFVIIGIKKNKFSFIIISALLASLAYYFRQNGILIVPIIVGYIFFNKPIKWKSFSVLFICIFILASLPNLVIRTILYGGPFDYGCTSNIFAESYEELNKDCGTGVVHKITLQEFLQTHTPKQIVFRAFTGMLRTSYLMMKVTNPIMFSFVLFGMLKFEKKQSFVTLSFIVWFIAFSWIHSIYSFERFYITLIPISIIMSSYVIYNISKRTPYPTLTIFVIFLLSLCFLIAIYNRYIAVSVLEQNLPPCQQVF